MEAEGWVYPLPHKTDFFKGQAARKADNGGCLDTTMEEIMFCFSCGLGHRVCVMFLYWEYILY